MTLTLFYDFLSAEYRNQIHKSAVHILIEQSVQLFTAISCRNRKSICRAFIFKVYSCCYILPVLQRFDYRFVKAGPDFCINGNISIFRCLFHLGNGVLYELIYSSTSQCDVGGLLSTLPLFNYIPIKCTQ